MYDTYDLWISRSAFDPKIQTPQLEWPRKSRVGKEARPTMCMGSPRSCIHTCLKDRAGYVQRIKLCPGSRFPNSVY